MEIRRGLEIPATEPAQRLQAMAEQIVRKIEPDLKGDVSRLQTYVEFYKRESVRDPRLFPVDVSATADSNGTVVLEGFVEYLAHRQSLELLLRTLGFSRIDNRIVVLADHAEMVAVGTIRASRSFVFDRIAEPRETLTEALSGEPVFILRHCDSDYDWIHTADGYVGYIRAADVDVIDRSAFGAVVKTTKNSPGIESAIGAAQKLIGTKYVWGGRTADGIDCSGLTQMAYASQGINLPRDADQQAYVGRFVATSWYRDGMSRGDLMFFISRRGTIGHVAIYLGENQFLEAADEGVKISSLNPKDSNYEPKRDRAFAFAKRVVE